MESKPRRPSPALLVAIVALTAALAGTAVGGVAVTALNGKEKRQVTRIAKGQANKRISKRAPGLAVASAQSAGSANPVAFAQVAADGTVSTTNSKALAQANLVNSGPIIGYYCFGNLPFVPRGANATVDWNGGGVDTIALIGLGGNPNCPAGTELFVDTRHTDTTGSTPSGFFLTLYR